MNKYNDKRQRHGYWEQDSSFSKSHGFYKDGRKVGIWMESIKIEPIEHRKTFYDDKTIITSMVCHYEAYSIYFNKSINEIHIEHGE